MAKKASIVKQYKVVCMVNLGCTGATKKKRDDLMKKLKPVCDIDNDIYLTYPKRLVNDCEEIAEKNPDILIIAGGDGTFVVTPKFLKDAFGERAPPKLYFFELGQENKLGVELRDSFGIWNYLRDKVYNPNFRNIEKLVEMIKRKEPLKTKKIPLIKVENEYIAFEKKGKKIKETFYTFDVAHDGLVTSILDDYYGLNERKSELNLRDDFFLSFIKPGFRDVARVFLKVTFQQPFYYSLGLPQSYFNSYKGKLIVDGKDEEITEFIGLSASTIKSSAVGAKTFHKAGDGLMHLRGGYIHPLHLLLHFNNLYSGKDINVKGWIDKTASRIEFYREKQGYVSCGGELKPSLNAVASLDQALEFVVLQEKGF